MKTFRTFNLDDDDDPTRTPSDILNELVNRFQLDIQLEMTHYFGKNASRVLQKEFPTFVREMTGLPDTEECRRWAKHIWHGVFADQTIVPRAEFSREFAIMALKRPTQSWKEAMCHRFVTELNKEFEKLQDKRMKKFSKSMRVLKNPRGWVTLESVHASLVNTATQVKKEEERIRARIPKGHTFVDHEFPASRVRLEPWNSVAGTDWESLSGPLLEDRFVVTSGPLRSSQVCPAPLNPENCWFLSTMAILADRGLLDPLVISREQNNQRLYMCRLYMNGKLVSITIDDQVPVTIQPNETRLLRYAQPVLTKNKSKYVCWAPLFEKAYAKLHGGYEAIRDGFVYHAMEDLTGMPTEVHLPHDENFDKDLVFSKLVAHLQRGYILCVGSDTAEKVKATGLRHNQAYSILRVENLEEESWEVRLLQLRDPFRAAGQSWTGPYSDKSPEMTPTLRQRLQHTAKPQPGTFWVSFDDVCKHFRSIMICKVEPSWFTSSHMIEFPSDNIQSSPRSMDGNSPDTLATYSPAAHSPVMLLQPNQVKIERDSGGMESDIGILLHITENSRAAITIHQQDNRRRAANQRASQQQFRKFSNPPAYLTPTAARTLPATSSEQKEYLNEDSANGVYDAIGCFIIRLPSPGGFESVNKLDDYDFVQLLPPRRRRTSHVEVALEASPKGTTYLLLPFRLGLESPPPKCPLLSVHCANPGCTAAIRPPKNCLRRCIHLCFDANRTHARMKVQSVAMKSGKLAAEIMTLRHGETILLLVNNLLEAKYFSIKADCSQSRGTIFCTKAGVVEFGANSLPFSKTEDTVPPMSRQLIMACVARDPRKGYSWRVSFNYGLRKKPDPSAAPQQFKQGCSSLYAPVPFFGEPLT